MCCASNNIIQSTPSKRSWRQKSLLIQKNIRIGGINNRGHIKLSSCIYEHRLLKETIDVDTHPILNVRLKTSLKSRGHLLKNRLQLTVLKNRISISSDWFTLYDIELILEYWKFVMMSMDYHNLRGRVSCKID